MGSDGLIPKVPKMYPKPASVDKLTADQWTLYDKITFGGLGYGAFVLPSNFFIIILTCIFPPIGQIILILGDTITPEIPFFTIDSLYKIFDTDPIDETTNPPTIPPSNIMKVIYSVILTSLFYIPGLVYVLGNIADKDNKTIFPKIPVG